MATTTYLIDEDLKKQLQSYLQGCEASELALKLEKTERNKQWSEPVKWLFDLLKSLLIWGIVVLVTWLYLNDKEDARSDKRFKTQKETELRINSINNFKKSSQKYLFTSGEIFWDRFSDPSTYALFTSSINDDLLLDADDLRYYYNKDATIFTALDNFDSVKKRMFTDYLKPVIYKTRITKDLGLFKVVYDSLSTIRSEIIKRAMAANSPSSD